MSEQRALAYAALNEAIRHAGMLRWETVSIQAPLARYLIKAIEAAAAAAEWAEADLAAVTYMDNSWDDYQKTGEEWDLAKQDALIARRETACARLLTALERLEQPRLDRT